VRDRVRHVHCVGIGGSGMSGIAEVLLNQGYTVSGSDLAAGPVTQRLAALGARTAVGHAPEHIAGADVVVVSSAVTADNPEVLAARAAGVPVVPRAEMLAELMRLKTGIAIAGTHGKTTTTSLIASVLAEGGLDPTFIIGGRLLSAGAHARLGAGEYLVAEADESDASFLYLHPILAVVTNVDLDHMDTYGGDPRRLEEAFLAFLHQLPFHGLAVLCTDDPVLARLRADVSKPVLTYGTAREADLRAEDITQEGLRMRFTARQAGRPDLPVTLNLPGRHNVHNALAAIAIGREVGVADAAAARALERFEGIGRRLEVLGEVGCAGARVTLVDDYGHHPREIAATLEAVHGAFPGRRVVTVFQPHRYTRTRDLFEDFAHVLAQCEALVLLEVYAAGEAPLPGADSRALARAIRARGTVQPVYVPGPGALAPALRALIADGDVVLTLGAGSIGAAAAQLPAALGDAA
jgi:UDP-N-acetylmuramate--alanine ligase